MSLQGTRRELGDVIIVDFSGKITLGEGSAMLRKTVRDLIDAGNKKILLSLYDVDYIDSSGHRRARQRLHHGEKRQR